MKKRTIAIVGSAVAVVASAVTATAVIIKKRRRYATR